MQITINDDFDLDKITNSGQAFRIGVSSDETYRFVTGKHILYIQKASGAEYNISAYNFEKSRQELSDSDTMAEWCSLWTAYFDLSRDYAALRRSIPDSDSFLTTAAECGAGLRILRQDPWEMLITFIISQRKNIPAIKESVEKICKRYGTPVKTAREEIYLFPSAIQMRAATLEELRGCSLGYRDSYILDAVERSLNGKTDLYALYSYDYDTLFEALKQVRGVGAKVSNCICLFAYAKTEAAPVDTWISKVIDIYYDGVNPFPQYADTAGIMQQYIFYYAQTHKDAF